jgi:hypothetical protein
MFLCFFDEVVNNLLLVIVHFPVPKQIFLYLDLGKS